MSEEHPLQELTLGVCPSHKPNKTGNNLGGFNMRKVLLATCVGAVAAFTAGAATATTN